MRQRDFVKLNNRQKVIYFHLGSDAKQVGVYETMVLNVLLPPGNSASCDFEIKKTLYGNLTPGFVLSCFAGRKFDETGKEYLFYPNDNLYVNVD